MTLRSERPNAARRRVRRRPLVERRTLSASRSSPLAASRAAARSPACPAAPATAARRRSRRRADAQRDAPALPSRGGGTPSASAITLCSPPVRLRAASCVWPGRRVRVRQHPTHTAYLFMPKSDFKNIIRFCLYYNTLMSEPRSIIDRNFIVDCRFRAGGRARLALSQRLRLGRRRRERPLAEDGPQRLRREHVRERGARHGCEERRRCPQRSERALCARAASS